VSRRWHFRRWFKRRGYILLFGLAGALAIAAVTAFLVTWFEGETAATNAQELLAESDVAPGEVPPGSTEDYVQPDAPEVSGTEDIGTLLEKELSGYSVIARLDIERLALSLPVLSKTSAKALQVSVCYYSGPEPGADGNLVITGHNYRNGAHFGRLDELRVGDTVSLTTPEGKRYVYRVTDRRIIAPNYIKAVEEYEGKSALTLLTCTDRGNKRLIVKCAETE
jgi:sortase A